jgi:Protein of unknown function (DUF2934)
MAGNVKTEQQVSGSATIRSSRTSAGFEEIIRRRAYQLYVEGGRREGHAKEDWLQAEREALGTACRKGIRADLVVH